jgi:hypothetical protein
MVTICWSVDGFHVVEFLLTETKFNTAYLVEYMIPLLTTRLEMAASKRRRILYRLHCDNVGHHNSSRRRVLTNDHEFQRIPHPPSSPDLAPSNFYLLPIRYPEETARKQGIRGTRGSSKDDSANSGANSPKRINGRFQRLG